MTTNESTKQEGSRIPVAYLILGYENNRNAIIDFYRNAKSMINWVTDATVPEAVSKLDWLDKEVFTARDRGIKCKAITDITSDNLPYCKRRMSRIDELRHIDGIGVVFGITDIEFIAMVPSLVPREEHNIQFIHSDSESVVGYKQLCFDMLWNRATPAQSRIGKLEGNITGGSVATETTKTVIDRIYACRDCHQTFIHSYEVQEHKKTTGHENYREYPLV